MYFEHEEYLFVHAGFNDENENPFVDQYSMLWTSREKYVNSLLKDRTIIHAHAPVSLDITKKQITNNSKVINIDAGCVYSTPNLGKLIAYEVNTRSIFIVK